MWITLLLTGFSLAVYQINDRIAHYFEYPTSTEIDVVPSQNMTFPRVTICNDNYIKLSGAQELGEHNLYVIRPGAFLGLMIMLDVNQSDYFIQPSLTAGYRVWLHEPNEPPRMMKMGFKVGAGQSVNVDVSVIKISRQKPPYGTCTDEENYNQVDCEWKCFNREVVKVCNCRPIYMKAIGNESVCDYYDERCCADKFFDDFYFQNLNQEFSCHCPPACNEIMYPAFVTGARYSNNILAHLSSVSKYSQKYIKENIVSVNVYLSSMQYTKLVTTAGYSVMSLLSDLGGALGLVLGSTFLTLIEIVEMLHEFIVYNFAKQNLPEKKQKK
ncbi:hypothetical protein HELRODRAFT_180244 [Helobdella robusta]|uniref:Uncharacterized protein n=1 Tax=Helobdella robusta TaxID=6412 RepID=T1FFM2_HELRO|nr:hypothetical protein HELRODRAFT_180244 [Helobdella robusta]ESN94076.1 hypothetical protein HELRODRAFT_180244 [Helobdella robusta]